MAVIKIVPMPGAEGQQGEAGAVGPQGPQGDTGATGPAGADAVWYYNGEYNPGASYVIGDVVTYDGQLWYRKNANGGNVGDTPSEGLFWDLLAAKGESGTPLNFWNYVGERGLPTEDGLLVVDGISGREAPGEGNVAIFAGPSASVILAGNNGEFLKDSNVPENQIATIGDITEAVGIGNNGEVTRYSPLFQATGLTFTGTGTTYPTYNSYYVKNGRMVSFNIEVNLSTVTNFGTGQYKLQLPFTPQVGFNHFTGWVWADPNVDPDTGTGHTILNADTAGITDILDLHYLKQSGGANSPIREGLFVQDTPVTLSTISKIYVNGTYIISE